MNIRKLIFLAVAALTLSPFITAPLALLLGLVLAQTMEHPYPQSSQKATHLLLKISVIGLGFGMNIYSAITAGKEGLLFTLASILIVLATGYFVGRKLKIDFKTTSLISAGTAICGGSAIAALSPVMKANQQQISVALGTVFILNSAALFLFPAVGHWLNLSQNQFGLWCAISIHDTSSVVGAASKYGEQALHVATTVKLSRALWIIPVSFGATYLFKTNKTKVQAPYFIALFVLAVLANTYFPFLTGYSHYLVSLAKSGLSLTLFLIGSGLSFKTLKGVGSKPLVLGTTLWALISVFSLYAIMVVL
ncbi:YeiH family protein [Pedobacter africanus]|uniref:Conserved hypothetical integral membrane protein n=1 Tax=Pedobacter africanus TaxID=151894 RepID=A0A1W2B392_9SPHI|nr:putative sulfate exporter family transporter [Pedobacter africanus]SMC67409.1 conserved hypothetical integral membrane protein [Pedobacter africanus]